MKKNKLYNIFKHIIESYRGTRMILDGIIAELVVGKTFNINESVKEYLHYIEEEPFYISPQFENVQVDRQISTLNPKFILFSAPGATGKSALAKCLSNKLNAIYWNLAKIKLGSNSFSGTILKAIGNENYSNFILSLNHSDATLVIDALDEAEVVSGRQMLGEFISDISEILNDNKKPSVILLARTETAQFIASYCVEREIPLMHYEIGYFSEKQAEEFVYQKANLKTSVDIECMKQYFLKIKSSISGDGKNSFLGYAPVLEAISTHIQDTKNRQVLLNKIVGTDNSIDIILKILKDLIEREKIKVVDALKLRCEVKYPEFKDWECVYSEEEQLVRIINYVLFNESQYRVYEIEGFPSHIVDEYQEIIETFLSQHPFIRSCVSKDNGFEFAGPAFRDYTLSCVATINDYSEYAQWYFEESKEENYFPSQLFFEFYTQLNDYNVYSNHLSLLYESFRSKLTAYEYSFLHCSETDEDSYLAIFGLTEPRNGITQETELTMEIAENRISMSQVVNVSLDVPKLNVVIESNQGNARISNSSLICKKLEFRVENLTLESYKPSSCMLVSEENVSGIPNVIEIASNDDIAIDFPNIKDYYKFIPYKFELDDSSSLDIKRVLHAMRCILVEFRTHRKDTLAKDAERIDNVTVGGNVLKREVLEFFKKYGVIYKSDHLYKINVEKMQELRISYLTLIQAEYDNFNKAFEEFKKYHIEQVCDR